MNTRSNYSRFLFARLRLVPTFVFGVAVLCSLMNLQAAEPKRMELKEKWQGTFPMASMKLLAKDQQASRMAFVGSSEQWSKVWKAFDAEGKQPKVDFDKNIVVMVKNVRYLNRIFVANATLDAGTLKVVAGETRTARPIGDHVHCAMFVVPRAGIDKISDGGRSTISIKPNGALVGKIEVKDTEATFKNAGVWIRLWEYDPFLADASAKLFDSVKLTKIKHTTGKPSHIEFSLGDKSKINKRRQYYVTIFVYKDGMIGNNKSEIFFLDGFNKVKLPGKIEGTFKKLNR
jgi:hypothetical protein